MSNESVDDIINQLEALQIQEASVLQRLFTAHVKEKHELEQDLEKFKRETKELKQLETLKQKSSGSEIEYRSPTVSGLCSEERSPSTIEERPSRT
jgi:hypothetical protein